MLYWAAFKKDKDRREAAEKELALTKEALGEKIINNPRGINKSALKIKNSVKWAEELEEHAKEVLIITPRKRRKPINE